MAYPTGEAKPGPLRVDFDRRLKVEFHGSKITSDAGLLAYRELDHALGLTGMAGSILTEARRGKNIRHLVEGLFRQSVFGCLAGYEDVNDAVLRYRRQNLVGQYRAVLLDGKVLEHLPDVPPGDFPNLPAAKRGKR